MYVLHFGHFFENRKNSALTPSQNDDPVTRTWKMIQMTHWPGDPMTQFHVWSTVMTTARSPVQAIRYDTIRYDTRCCCNVRSKAGTSQLNLYRTEPTTTKWEKKKNEKVKTDKLTSIAVNSSGNPWSHASFIKQSFSTTETIIILKLCANG